MNPFSIPHRNAKYLKFIRSKLCVKCGTDFTIHAHHVRLGTVCGIGIKPSDYACVPLCAQHHNELHYKGERTFWRGVGEVRSVLIGLLEEFLADENAVPAALINAIEEPRRCETPVSA